VKRRKDCKHRSCRKQHRLKLNVILSALGDRALDVEVMSRNGRVVIVAPPTGPGGSLLHAGDVVREINSDRVASTEDFMRAVERVRKMGVKLKLSIQRHNEKTVKINVGSNIHDYY